MFHLIFYQPDIPPNTGNAIRLCANTGAQLHLIEPLGFSLEDKKLRRAGLDYREYSPVQVHSSLAAVRREVDINRLYAFTTKGRQRYDNACFKPRDGLLFGPETRGLPEELLGEFEDQQLLRLPMVAGSRSLNLSNCAAIALFEAWRQCDFSGSC